MKIKCKNVTKKKTPVEEFDIPYPVSVYIKALEFAVQYPELSNITDQYPNLNRQNDDG